MELDTFELVPATEYTVQLVSVVTSRQGGDRKETMELQESSLALVMREESKAVESSFVLPPEPPAELKLEAATTASLKLKWEDPREHVNQSYIVSVQVITSKSFKQLIYLTLGSEKPNQNQQTTPKIQKP